MIDTDRAFLLGAERLEDARGTLEALRDQLARAPHWRPARGLGAQCDEALALIADMRQRLRRKLVIALVGPTGAGKSTLLNALAGVDGLSPSGVSRPTTREVVVYCRDRDDAAPIIARLGGDRVRVVSSPAAARLDAVILVDTPDINSAQLAEHQPMVEAVLGQADVMLCVFNVENPKARSDAEFLAPFVAAFPSRFVIAVLNHCDRQAEAELQTDIRPDFERHLAAAWDRAPAAVLCVSARSNLRAPAWPAGAEPRHGFDEFPALVELVYGSLNRASAVLDARVERARHLVAAVQQAVGERASAAAAELGGAREAVARLHQSALVAAAGGLGESTSGLGAGADALFYQRLANAWWGPVGWLVGLWARLLIVGAGFSNMLRVGNPLRQLWGVVTSLARFKQARSDIDDAESGAGVDVAALRYRDTYERGWPDLAERLVAGGFDPALRDGRGVVPDGAALQRTLAAGWSDALASELDRATERLSGMGLQLFLNAWVLVPAFAVAGISVARFVSGRVLSGDWFTHALVTLMLLWLLAFVVLQVGARLVGGRRLVKRAFATLVDGLGRGPDPTREAAVLTELDAVGRLAREAPRRLQPRHDAR